MTRAHHLALRSNAAIGFAMLSAFALGACRGQESESPPIHMNPNMQSQPRYDPQSVSKFFEDRRTMRPIVDGAVARGLLNDDEALTQGRDGVHYVGVLKTKISEPLLHRGQERFNIYCTPCHDKTGNGNGTVAQRGFPKPTNLQEAYARGIPEGQIFAAMTYGVRNMPSYAGQIPVDDRWAIVAYVRALQFSQNAAPDDVPPEQRASLPVEMP